MLIASISFSPSPESSEEIIQRGCMFGAAGNNMPLKGSAPTRVNMIASGHVPRLKKPTFASPQSPSVCRHEHCQQHLLHSGEHMHCNMAFNYSVVNYSSSKMELYPYCSVTSDHCCSAWAPCVRSTWNCTVICYKIFTHFNAVCRQC